MDTKTKKALNMAIPKLARDVMDKLPPESWAVVPGSRGDIALIKRGVTGYYHVSTIRNGTADDFVAKLNADHGVTPAQAAAMLNGSMFGFDTPSADPDNEGNAEGPFRGLGDGK